MTEKPDGFEDQKDVAERAERIAKHNDLLRRFGIGGRILATIGVQGLTENTRQRLIAAIQEYDDFSEGVDPYGEHDFGAVDVDGGQYFFKIDYYDASLEGGSPDPADPDVTERVMTIMKSSEY